MHLLVLGGTGFVGRTVALDAVTRGWTVTLFNRGLSASPPDGVEVVRGDRTVAADLAGLAAGTWDVVVDTWSGPARAVRDSATALAGQVEHYVYVSSCSVYRPPLACGVTEDAPLVDASPEAEAGDYAAQKAGAELAAREVFGDRVLLARAGLILGPYENVGRLPWWLHRIARGGPVLAPGPVDLPLQFIDVRDLAGWLLTNAEQRTSGAFNVVSRPGHTTMGALLAACQQVIGGNAELRWTDPDTILAAGVQPWTELPIWIPPGHPARALQEIDTTRVHRAGLHCRPVADTVTDTWAWLHASDSPPLPRHAHAVVGLPAAVEAAILAGSSGPKETPRRRRPPARGGGSVR